MDRKLIGVGHKDEEELNRLKNELDLYLPSKTGLELPEDYSKREEYGISVFLFGQLASYLTERGVSVIPLENPNLWDYHQAIEVAKAVKDGRLTEECLKDELELTNRSISPFAAPEAVYAPKLFSKRYSTALEIIRNSPTLEDVVNLWEKSNTERETYILKKILSHGPDLVIIGNGHARKLKDRLPGYKYLDLNNQQ